MRPFRILTLEHPEENSLQTVNKLIAKFEPTVTGLEMMHDLSKVD